MPRPTIERDNPSITNSLPATAVLAGCREHSVIAGETRAMISVQNGFPEPALVRAIPDLPANAAGSWPMLAAGQRVLIPLA